MTQEDKQLLLQDLCARLPYGVICHTEKGNGHLCSINQTIFGTEYGINIKASERDYFNDREEVVKPYLRPMSSMTEEELKELRDIFNGDIAFYDRNTLRPHKIRIFVDEDNIPVYGIIIYLIDYKKEQNSRSACGGYYAFEFNNSMLMPHPYQESICW